MSEAWNERMTDEQLEQLNMRAKYVLSQLQVVTTHTYQRKSVSEIARLLGCSRNMVIWMQHVLQMRNGRGLRQGPVLGRWPRAPPDDVSAAG